MCHLILLLPVFALALFWLLPLVVAGPVYTVLLVFSLWMYYFFFRQMRRPVVSGMEAMQDRVGEVIAAEGDGLRIRLGGEIWRARSADMLHPGDRVRVIGFKGMQLAVARMEQKPSS